MTPAIQSGQRWKHKWSGRIATVLQITPPTVTFEDQFGRGEQLIDFFPRYYTPVDEEATP